jgi:hypothetical protein
MKDKKFRLYATHPMAGISLNSGVFPAVRFGDRAAGARRHPGGGLIRELISTSLTRRSFIEPGMEAKGWCRDEGF